MILMHPFPKKIRAMRNNTAKTKSICANYLDGTIVLFRFLSYHPPLEKSTEFRPIIRVYPEKIRCGKPGVLETKAKPEREVHPVKIF